MSKNDANETFPVYPPGTLVDFSPSAIGLSGDSRDRIEGVVISIEYDKEGNPTGTHYLGVARKTKPGVYAYALHSTFLNPIRLPGEGSLSKEAEEELRTELIRKSKQSDILFCACQAILNSDDMTKQKVMAVNALKDYDDLEPKLDEEWKVENDVKDVLNYLSLEAEQVSETDLELLRTFVKNTSSIQGDSNDEHETHSCCRDHR